MHTVLQKCHLQKQTQKCVLARALRSAGFERLLHVLYIFVFHNAACTCRNIWKVSCVVPVPRDYVIVAFPASVKNGVVAESASFAKKSRH